MAEAGYSDRNNEPDNEPTKEELYQQAQELDIDGRSQMNKDELAKAIADTKTNN